ncbi:peptidoglycan-binding domain-containing protein [Thalassobaculum sp.]|uniref:peptidoglycan-binding domain-containing protein n=1 Tax=Thalassobaculum sp. TaxID=2022740 RepID=UPI0032EF7C51
MNETWDEADFERISATASPLNERRPDPDTDTEADSGDQAFSRISKTEPSRRDRPRIVPEPQTVPRPRAKAFTTERSIAWGGAGLAILAIAAGSIGWWRATDIQRTDVSPALVATTEHGARDPSAAPASGEPPTRGTGGVGRYDGSLDRPTRPDGVPGVVVDPRPVAAPTAKGPAEPAEQPATPRRWTVREVQRALSELGYYEGAVDGKVGPMTRAALRSFQKREGLDPTGRIGSDVTRALERKSLATTEGRDVGTSRIVLARGPGSQNRR